MLEELKARFKKVSSTATKADDALASAREHVATHEEDVRQASAVYSKAERDRVALLSAATKSNDFTGVEEARATSTHLRGVLEGFEARLDRARAQFHEAQNIAETAGREARATDAELQKRLREETTAYLFDDLLAAIKQHGVAQNAYRAFVGNLPSDGEIGERLRAEGFLTSGPQDEWHIGFSVSEFTEDPHPHADQLARRNAAGTGQ